jgi:hypothetical protein
MELIFGIIILLFILIKGTIIYLLGHFLYRIDEALRHLDYQISMDEAGVYFIIRKIGSLLKILGILIAFYEAAIHFFQNQ